MEVAYLTLYSPSRDFWGRFNMLIQLKHVDCVDVYLHDTKIISHA